MHKEHAMILIHTYSLSPPRFFLAFSLLIFFCRIQMCFYSFLGPRLFSFPPPHVPALPSGLFSCGEFPTRVLSRRPLNSADTRNDKTKVSSQVIALFKCMIRTTSSLATQKLERTQ